MCGIYGMVSLVGAPLRHPDLLDRMGRMLRHRGPDGRGTLERPHAAFGVERLRIVDRHPRADQPFGDRDGPIWLACNGQIYNSATIRAARPHPYRSLSDVEPILPLYQAGGAAALAGLDGMFALAIWDEPRRALVLARDRAGEKPLFYRVRAAELWFASEPAALLLGPGSAPALDLRAVDDFLTWGYVRAPRTMFADVRSVEPGTILELAADGARSLRYWDPVASFRRGFGPDGPKQSGATIAGPERAPRYPPDAVATLQGLLESAVQRQIRSDVPLGVFLSGGVDSALLAALTTRVRRPERTCTFALRFTERSFDESRRSREVAGLLGTEHREVVGDQAALTEALGAVRRGMAEPLADPAVLPTWLLARSARESVGVVLSGEGADELFGGYPTYLGHRLAPLFQALPPGARTTLGRLAAGLPSSNRRTPVPDLVRRFVEQADRPWRERHLAWFGTGLDQLGAVRHGWWAGNDTPSFEDTDRGGPDDDLVRAMLLDYRTYLPDDLLVKVDRATMLSGLECRAPFLDRAVQTFALGLSPSQRIRGITTKWLLKQAAGRWLPARVVHRRKRGFSVPIADWINHGLAPEVDRLLEPSRLAARGWLHPARVGQLLSQHRAGRANHARPLWTVFTLESWLDHWAPEASA